MPEILCRITNRYKLDIAVLVQIPEKPKGLIFLVHGWKSSKQSNSVRTMSEVAISQGYTAVRFDCTHSNGDSDGDITQSTISTFIDDLADVIEWARSQPWFQTPYVLGGSSLGGIAILEHARHHQHEIAAIAPIAAVISGALSIEARSRNDRDNLEKWRDTGFEEQETSSGSAIFPWSHMEDRLKYNALDYAARLTMPVFMCVGSLDTSCPPDQQELLYNHLGGSHKKLFVINGAPHSFIDPAHIKALKNYFTTWLARL